MAYICFEIKGQVAILIVNSGISVWEWVGVSVKNKCGYKHEFDSNQKEF